MGDAGSPDGDAGRVLAVSKHLLQTRWIAAAAFPSPVVLVGEGEDVVVLEADVGVDRRGNRYVLAPNLDAKSPGESSNRPLGSA